MPLDLSPMLDNVHQFWVNAQTVKLRVVRADGDRDFRVESAVRTQVTRREREPSGGAFTVRETVWNLPAKTCFYTPEVGYLIIESDGRQWTIQQVDDAAHDTRYRCTVLDLELTAGLTDTVEIWSPTERLDAAGGRVNTFLPKYQGVQAKVQELSADRAAELGQDDTATTYQVFVGRRLYVTSDDQLRWVQPDGPPTILEILSHEGADQLDRLQVLTCRKGLWP